MVAYYIAGTLKVNPADRNTIALEVGIQNAGTAMMVALSIMSQPELAVVPLLYGILMNIPAFSFVVWALAKEDTKRTIENPSDGSKAKVAIRWQSFHLATEPEQPDTIFHKVILRLF